MAENERKSVSPPANWRCTKIVCTIGPASQDEETLRQLVQAGMDVARFNFSHADYDQTSKAIALIRRLSLEEDRVIAILQDLQGPRLRTGELADGWVNLTEGTDFMLTTRPVPGNAREVSVYYPNLTKDIGPGDTILIDDGLLEVRVKSATATDLRCQVIRGGVLKPSRGINIPGVTLGMAAITEKDKRDIAFGIEHGVDYIAVSFVHRAEDIIELKKVLRNHNVNTPVIAKIENREAVDDCDRILSAADGVMVARGDLGIELPAEEVPLIQKQIIERSRAAGKPVITATQMLESMIDKPRPTRAEASDVANAIFDGTSAVMLSGETSIGTYPVEAVQTIARIAQTTERALPYENYVTRAAADVAQTVTDAISQSACEIAYELEARAILVSTISGYTARMIAKNRPSAPIIAVTTTPSTQAELALVWGVLPLLDYSYNNLDDKAASCIKLAKDRGLIATGDIVIITSGVPLGTPGRTNMLQVRIVD